MRSEDEPGARHKQAPSRPLDARAQLLLSWLDLIGAPRLHTRSVEEARREFRLTIDSTSHVAAIEQVRSVDIPTPAGPLSTRVYIPKKTRGQLPILVWFHGGGFVIGDLSTADPTCRALASQSGAMVVSVDYRRAPEHPPPAALEDCLAATAWLAEHAGELGGDGSRIAVGGDSAGGTLAALVALGARDHGPQLALQLLVYPATDLTLSHPSVREFGRSPFLLDMRALEWFTDHFLQGSAADDPAVSPLFASELRGVAPALVITAEYDPVRDEAEAFAARLRDSGVAVEQVRYAGQIHGFFTMDLVFPAARRAQRRAVLALAEHLDLPLPKTARLPRLLNAATLARLGSATAGSSAIMLKHHTEEAQRRIQALTGPATRNAQADQT